MSRIEKSPSLAGRYSGFVGALLRALVVFLIVVGPSVAKADILQDKLNDLIARVEKATSDAAASAGQEAATAIVIAGREMTQAINQFRSAYEKTLTKTLDELDEKTAKKLHELETAVEKFETRVSSAMEEATKSAQQLVNTLPIANHVPQVRRYQPRFAAPKRAAPPLLIRIDGNFVSAAREGFTPHLRFKNKDEQRKYEAAGVTTQQLNFELANDDIAPHVNPRAHCEACPPPPPQPKLRLVSLDLVVPFEERRCFFFKQRRELSFRLLVSVLPGGPGFLTLNTPGAAREVQTLRSERIRQNSAVFLHDVDETYEAPLVPDGWALVPNSGRFVLEAGGQNEDVLWWKRPISYDPVKYRVFTKYNERSDSGDVTFHIECDIEGTSPTADEVQVFSLSWGESWVFRKTPGWRIDLHSYAGDDFPIAGAMDLPGLLSVREIGDGQIEVRAASLEEM